MSGYSGGYADYGLDSLIISPNTGDIVVPKCRLDSAERVQGLVRRLWENDEKRSMKRSKLNGLVGGFAPFRMSRMRDAGMAQNCNANWGTAASYIENASGAFYDLSSEAPGVALVKTLHGNDEEKDEWSSIMSEEADIAITSEQAWDYEMQVSQWQMSLLGCGPLMWEDAFKVFPRALLCGDFKVPERTRSDVKYYEVCSADVDFYPPQLYDFIKDPDAATSAGWDVDYTQRVIANALDIRQPEQRAYDWDFYVTEIKNGSLSYYDDSKVCHLAFVWWKEFDGRITQAIVERETTTAPDGKIKATVSPENDHRKRAGEQTASLKFLFKHVGRYDDFKQCVAPMYFDRGCGGYHHSVTGMSKMYSPMEFENRLLCRLMDGAFAPKVLFRPTTTEATQKMQLTVLGDFGIMPKGWEAEQSPINGFINEGLAMYNASSSLMRSNLSSYRQQTEPTKRGNPETKFGRQIDAYQQSALNKTTFNRYYKQLDTLYGEIVRRLCNLNSSNATAVAFRKRCTDRGVPEECFGRIKSVEAVRVVGEGSAFLRKSTLGEMQQSGVMMGCPEEGQNNFRNDMIAAMAGSKSVTRYNPPQKRKKLPTDHYASAIMQVAGMKIGVPPIITDTQNHVTYAGVFLSASVQAVQSVQKGANPQEVIRFVDLAAPAAQAHLQKVAKDPLRHAVVQQMEQQLKQLAGIVDKIKKMAQQQQKQQQQQRQKTQQVMTQEQLAQMQAQGDERRKNQKLQGQLWRDKVKTRSQLALADASTASDIHRKNRLAAFQE